MPSSIKGAFERLCIVRTYADGSPFLIIEVDIGGQGGVERALAAVDFVAEPGKLCRRAIW